MSETISTKNDRVCSRCSRPVSPERFRGAEGVTWLWRCACGWSSVVAESGVVSRRRVREAVDRARGADGGT
ncbi:MAG: hypothetical protein ACOCXM_03425 [Myxococcota bacterium]